MIAVGPLVPAIRLYADLCALNMRGIVANSIILVLFAIAAIHLGRGDKPLGPDRSGPTRNGSAI